MAAPPTQPMRPSTISTFRWSTWPIEARFQRRGTVSPSGADATRSADARLTQTLTPPAASRSKCSRAPFSGPEPRLSTTSRTATPSAALSVRAWANTSPTTPGLKPNWLMCTDEEAEAMSSSIGGEKDVPPTSTSADDAALAGNGSASPVRLAGRPRSSAARALRGETPAAVLLTAVVDVGEADRDRAEHDKRAEEAKGRPGPAKDQEQDRADDDGADADAEQPKPEPRTQLHAMHLAAGQARFTSPGEDE